MRLLLVHNMRLLPNDHDLMQLTLDDVRSLQTRLQQDLSKLSSVNFIIQRDSIVDFFLFLIRSNKRN